MLLEDELDTLEFHNGNSFDYWRQSPVHIAFHPLTPRRTHRKAGKSITITSTLHRPKRRPRCMKVHLCLSTQNRP